MTHLLRTLKEREATRREALEQRLAEVERHFEMQAQRYDALVLELRRTVDSQRLQHEQREATLKHEIEAKATIIRDRDEAVEAVEKELWSTQQLLQRQQRDHQEQIAVLVKKEEKWKRRAEKLAAR